jgi:hypothetical protein
MRKDLQNIRESYERNVLRENVDRLEFLKSKYLPIFYSKLLHIWPDESNLPSSYEEFKKGTETNEKYKSYLDFLSDTIDLLISADPFSKVDMEKGAGYAGQYSDWILKTFLKIFDEKGEGAGKTLSDFKRFLNQDLYKVNSDLKIYDKNKSKVSLNKKNVRDINQIPDFTTLYYIIKPFVPKYQEEDIKDKSKVRILLDNSQYFVGVPLTLSASQSLGNNTRWCTAARSSNNTYYDTYTKDGPLYVVFLKKKDELVKFQFHFPSGQYMDSDDRSIDVFEFFSNHPIIGQVILDDYEKTEPDEDDLRKAKLLTGGISILDKEPDQFFQNLSVRNIVTMIVQGQLDLDRLNKGLEILSDAFENKATFNDEGMELTIVKGEADEFFEDFYNYGINRVIQGFLYNPVSVFFDGNEDSETVPFVLNSILSPQHRKNVILVYDDIAETPESSDEFYSICRNVLNAHIKKISNKYLKNTVMDAFKSRGLVIDKKGRKNILTIPYDSLLDVFQEGDTATFFNILENPSYYTKLGSLIPDVSAEQTEEEKSNFIDFVSQNIDRKQIAEDIIKKVDRH